MLRLRPLFFAALLVGCPPAADDSVPDSSADSATDSGEDSDTSGDAGFDAWTDGTWTATVTTEVLDTRTRTYVLVSNHPLRDSLPANGQVTIVEQPGQMVLRSGRLMLDALFALSIQEVRDNSVEQISDGAFASPVDCSCFETGEKWTWVWTRDTGYAVEHSLAMVDPIRSRNSLLFKVSDRKASVGGGEPTIVQDTGSGGSWPVSTDRAVWALGAWETLKFLDGAERTAFRDTAYTVISNTLEQDRVYVYDVEDGLYRGEQSFLDWREQSYASWTATDTVHIGMSKTLSTNMAHWRMMRVAAALATEKGDATAATKYGGWADTLGTAIDTELWLEEDGLYSAMKGTTLDHAALRKFDLLGESMAALWLADDARAAEMVSAYPHAAGGPPVLWPQQPLIPVYHNRGVWPFVTAYDLRAAKRAGNVAVFEHDVESLVRGAALNLSNMENFEFLTGANWHDDGAYSGPVVNSRRQLWSVAGFVALVTRGLVGIEATQEGLSISPFLTTALRSDLLAGSDELTLYGVAYRGATLDVTVSLPQADGGTGAYAVTSVQAGGVDVTGQTFDPGTGSVQVDVQLGSAAAGQGTLRMVQDGDFTQLWAPREPSISSLTSDGSRLTLGLDASGESGVQFNVFRDGARVAAGLTSGTWTDATSSPATSHCYAVETEFSSGNVSHHSPPRCWWGDSSQRVQSYGASTFTATGGALVTEWGRQHYSGWGAASHEISVSVTPDATGEHLVQATYGNGAGAVSTGVTAAHKWVTVRDGGTVVGEGPLLMPHLGTWDAWRDSNFVSVPLTGGVTYEVRITDAPNMSWLEHHARYQSTGGGADPYNYVNISEVKLLRMVQ